MEYEGRVLSRTKGFYELMTQKFGTLQCKVKGNLFEKSKYDNQIVVGDMVLFSKENTNDVGLIHSIQPRKSILSRTRVEGRSEQILAANIDRLLIVCSTKSPPFRHNLVLRMIVASKAGNIQPILILTKTDLAKKESCDELLEPYRGLGLDIISCSIHQKDNQSGYIRLRELLEEGVSIVAGHSGVGKSSLLNKSFPSLNLRVGNLIKKSSKGSHTTTTSRMYALERQGYVVDTPGIREYGLWQITRNNLDEYFPGFEDFLGECKHRNCNHLHEPGCLVKEALEQGKIHSILYEGYQSIHQSL